MAGILTEFLHLFKPLRSLAKKVYRNKIIKQPFHGGFIFFNAVDFSFLWTNHATAEQHDREIQDCLLQLSRDKQLFVDIGANIGIMTLSVALRNRQITVRSYDPNSEILKFLQRSIEANKLTQRVQVVNTAVSNYEGTAHMNFSRGSYAGHLSTQGTEVRVEHFNNILDGLKSTPTLFKLDVEGFETLLIPILALQKNPLHVFVVEMHPPGLNDISDPERNLSVLLQHGFAVTSVAGKRITDRNQVDNWDNIVCWYEGT